MSNTLLRRTALCAALVLTAGSAACANAPTEPAYRSLRAERRNADDDPPTTPCRSGWVQIDGVWVCAEP